ncbi:enolase C-terminal domain-like protein [Roseiconus lacunae]|uniref:enolase C-terminal domain-like protein n=1 Tax=Roseiconus lacunae TaxID=2605694 RepID=UPI0011F38BA5|nr:enolase C-terminal domain-like protein [Roseiconus lacunae]
MKSTDIRITDVRLDYEHYDYRTVMKFGGVPVDKATILNVHLDVVSREGHPGRGFGSMPLSNIWAFPSKQLSYDQTLGAMTKLAERFESIVKEFSDFGHPVDLGVRLEHQFVAAATALSTELALAEPIPKLAALVTGSPFDAAIHDAFGKLHGLSCYKTYGPDWMSHDVSHYLGDGYQGDWISDFVSETPKPTMPLYHLVGALDPLDDGELDQPTGDGLPDTLPQWIGHNGLTHMKIKLNGDDVQWDLERVIKVDRIAAECQVKRGVEQWFYSLDFNERCPNVEYLIEVLERIKEKSPAGFDRIQYVEQPTARDLKAHPDNKMHRAAELKPVVIDESLTDLETLLLAHEMGYTGAALKACKGQSQSLLMAVAIKKLNMFLCVQDLTCPGASLIHSAGLAAHIPGVAAIESNSRQYCPVANHGWDSRFPGIFDVKNGSMKTACLDGPGLGAVE